MPRARQKRREHDRELALAYLAVGSIDEIRLDRIIEEHVEKVLGATDQNLSLTAELLGMHRRSLQRYVRRQEQRRKKRGRPAKRGPAKRGPAKRGRPPKRKRKR